MSTSGEVLATEPPRWKRRVLLALVIFVVGVTVALWVTTQWMGAEGRSQLDRAIAAIEADDPRWRWEELLEDRPNPPRAENVYPLLESVGKLLVPWDLQDLEISPRRGLLDDLPTQALLDPERQAKLTAALAKQKAALALAPGLRAYPRGWAPLQLHPTVIGTPVPHCDDVSRVGLLLELDVEQLLQQNRPNEAADHIVAMLRCGDLLRDDPLPICQMFRMRMRYVVRQRIDRLLGLTQPSDMVCDLLRKEIAAQRRENPLLPALRGARAGVHALFLNLRSGAVSMTEFLETINIQPSGLEAYLGIKAGLYHLRLEQDHASALRWLDRACGIARLPVHEQPDAWKKYQRDHVDFARESRKRWRNLLTIQLVPDVAVLTDHSLSDNAHLACLETALALEQYRRRHGHWPARLEALQPELLPEIPRDPYTAKPLLYRIEADGCVVYTTGQDEVDDGGAKLSRHGEPGTDLGVRLWNPPQRRQPAR